MQELAARGAGAPHVHAGPVVLHGFLKLAEQGGHHVRAFQVVVVVGTVEVGGHHRDEVAAVLVAVGLAHLHARDFGNGVGLVGVLQRAGEDVFFADGLRGQLGVDARRAQVQQLAHAATVAFVQHVGLNHDVFIDEIGPQGIIGVDAAHLGGGQQHVFGPVFGKKAGHGGLVGQVELGRGAGDEVGVAPARELAQQCRAHHAPVAGDVNAGILFHE